jgi:predicted NBD/HSP70 family sugar kinase
MTGGGTKSYTKGSNSVQVRHYNERVVLDAIRRNGQASKADIARHAHLTPPAVAGIVDALIEAGLVEQIGKRFGQKGQPSTMLSLAADGAFSIGMHIGRRTLDAVCIDFTGNVRLAESHEYEFPLPDAVRRMGNKFVSRVKEMLGKKADRLVGFGISAPYFLSGWEQELGVEPTVSAKWREIDLTNFFSDLGSLELIVENDASAAAAAELVFGAGNRYKDFVYLSINTMIGGGLILDGVLQTGTNGNTAAYGPLPVSPSRLSTTPRASGTELLLRRASIYILMNHLNKNGVKIKRVRELEPLPPEAKYFLEQWQDDCADAIAQAIVSTISIIDVEAIVIDGLLPRAILQETVSRIQSRYSEIAPMGLVSPAIVCGTSGPQASALGAGILPIYSLFSPDSSVLTKKAVEKKPLLIRSSGLERNSV